MTATAARGQREQAENRNKPGALGAARGRGWGRGGVGEGEGGTQVRSGVSPGGAIWGHLQRKSVLFPTVNLRPIL